MRGTRKLEKKKLQTERRGNTTLTKGGERIGTRGEFDPNLKTPLNDKGQGATIKIKQDSSSSGESFCNLVSFPTEGHRNI